MGEKSLTEKVSEILADFESKEWGDEEIGIIIAETRDEVTAFVEAAADLSSKLDDSIERFKALHKRKTAIMRMIEKLMVDIAIEDIDAEKPRLSWELAFYYRKMEEIKMEATGLSQYIQHLASVLEEVGKEHSE